MEKKTSIHYDADEKASVDCIQDAIHISQNVEKVPRLAMSKTVKLYAIMAVGYLVSTLNGFGASSSLQLQNIS